MPNLRAVIQPFRFNDAGEDCWLYITGDANDLSLYTEADLGCPGFNEDTDEDIDPSWCFWSFLSRSTIEQTNGSRLY